MFNYQAGHQNSVESYDYRHFESTSFYSSELSNVQNGNEASAQIDGVILTYVYPIIFIFGVLGNILSLSVLLRKNMRKKSMSSYLSVLSMFDTLSLTCWCLIPYIEYGNKFRLIDWSILTCKGSWFVNYAVGDLSVWLVVAVTVERFIAVCYPLKAAFMCRKKVALKVGSMAVSLLICLFIHSLKHLFNY
ncbi:hypothetical protein HELRODRAFT_69644 [Helobdella robusta]|uniref:G-protein coupled receptors family 1 profile domain-containing protein n=1 Tax=Helobdella robusta TaxID=6412 RepID=T1FZX7_HELRO|nr:hypothetical protein HELRODRAFT_69644 [Helobdella robusta]ESN92976.1 hypothetical protein HELRODRAFT_69644 [Helobdella robusta]